MAHDKQAKDAGYEDDKKPKTRIASDGQEELTIVDTPLYLACEEMVKAKARLGNAQLNLEKTEEVCIEEMKKVKKKQINHKGDLLELVEGRTTEDHIRFKKS